MKTPDEGSHTENLVVRNIHALLERRAAEEQQLGWEERLARAITSFAGSMLFVYVHLVLYAAWIIVNVFKLPGVPQFDRSLVILAMAASVEAIFLSTFILISQNRMQVLADRRADLNLQISLLSEHEITRVIELLKEIGERVQVPSAKRAELDDLKEDVRPEAVLETIEREQGRAEAKSG